MMMKKSLLIFGVIILISFVLWVVSQETFEGNQANLNESTTSIDSGKVNSDFGLVNMVDARRIDIDNGFFMVVPERWTVEGALRDSVNIVSYGSPAYIVSLIPTDQKNSEELPVITLSTFTIDSRLTARDVANLVHNRRIADKLQSGTEECLFNTTTYSVTGMETFSYKEDNTDLDACVSEGTEVGIVETVIAKEVDNTNTLLASLVVSTSQEYETYRKVFFDLISSVE